MGQQIYGPKRNGGGAWGTKPCRREQGGLGPFIRNEMPTLRYQVTLAICRPKQPAIWDAIRRLGSTLSPDEDTGRLIRRG